MTVLSGVGAILVTIPQPVYEVARGKNVTLPCSITFQGTGTPKQTIVTWSATADTPGAQEVRLKYYNVLMCMILYYLSARRTLSSVSNVSLMLSLGNRMMSSLIILLIKILTSVRCMKAGCPWM